jgi:glycosyltransferase involved in cell wall biosynthesis
MLPAAPLSARIPDEDMKYVLITPARDEEAFIKKPLDSVCAQTALPERWVVVDDGSTDRTAEIVADYAHQHPWIELLRRPPRTERSFAGKAYAFSAGFERLRSLEFDVVANIDADISFEPDYAEFLLGKFSENPRLGVCGTAVREQHFDPLKDSFYHAQDVIGSCQFFRRACFEDIGGYTPIELGGIDWVAVRSARLKGWETRSFTEKRCYHHRVMGTAAKGILKARFDYGREDYCLGNHPFWQIFRVTYQMTKRPYVLGGLALLTGYVYALSSRMERPVSQELLAFHRREQLSRLRQLFIQLARTCRLKLRG